jgi:hypothetical protein
MQQLGVGESTATTSKNSLLPNAMMESMMKMTIDTRTKATITKREEDTASQERLHNLRREVSTMKDEIHRLKGVLEKLKQQQGDDVGGGEEKEEDDDDETEEGDDDDDDDASEDDGDGKSLSQR